MTARVLVWDYCEQPDLDDLANAVDVETLTVPVACTGRLGLWRPSTDVLDAVAAGLRERAGAAA